MTTQIGGFRPQATPNALVRPSGKLVTDTSDYYIALGRKLRSEAMRDMAISVLSALSFKSRDGDAPPNKAERFVDQALTPKQTQASKQA